MLFTASQRKGIIVLIILIVCAIVLPKQFLRSDHKLFVINDTIPTTPVKKTQKKRNLFLLPYSPEIEEVQNLKSFYQKKVSTYRREIRNSIIESIEAKRNEEYENSVYIQVIPVFSLKDDLNEMSFKEVMKNPYLTYEDVKQIFEAKRKYHMISFSILEDRKILPVDKLRKIKPYFK